MICTSALCILLASAPAPIRLQDEPLSAALAAAGENRAELESALERASEAHRGALAFLITHMPPRDLRTLSSARLLEETALAFEAWNAAPWQARVPEAIFREYVLPYANAGEARDPWRVELRRIALPLIEGAATPLEAAQLLNERLFAACKVRYSTERKRADQSPRESMESGIASCTGLSILLVDACRSVGVPARLAGTPNWVSKRGNHTWVEVWDGAWHFTGAAEPDARGFDHGWFEGDAAQARPGREHGIFAARWERTGTAFPLAWSRNADPVAAEEVTARYARRSAPEAAPAAQIFVKVLDAEGRRVPSDVVLMPSAGNTAAEQRGRSRGESADRNDLLAFQVALESAWIISASAPSGTARAEIAAQSAGGHHVTLALSADPLAALGARLRAWFEASAEERAKLEFTPAENELLRRDANAVHAAAWTAYREAAIHSETRTDFEARRVRALGQEAPFTLREVGAQPATGWPLVIAMHGGGGVPQRVNDRQWEVMQRYYRDQADLGYLYLALRAPNDAWNGFYDDRIAPLVESLIRAAILCAAVDPDRVSLIGYSHGGYGAFVIGTKIPDRFASIHASAAAPTDGETRGENLRCTRFTFMVGSEDTAYGRRERCAAFDRAIAALRGDRADIYPVRFELIEGNGHTGLPDRDKIRELLATQRDPRPRDLLWIASDEQIADCFWLRVKSPRDGMRIAARIDGRCIAIDPGEAEELEVLFDSRAIDLTTDLELDVAGVKSPLIVRPELRILADCLARRGDPRLAFDAALRWSKDDRR